MKFEVSNINVISSDYGDLVDDFWVNLQVDISEIGGSGAEVFNVNVVGCSKLGRILEGENILMGRGIIFAKEFTSELVLNVIEGLLKKSKADNWESVLSELSKYFERQ